MGLQVAFQASTDQRPHAWSLCYPPLVANVWKGTSQVHPTTGPSSHVLALTTRRPPIPAMAMTKDVRQNRGAVLAERRAPIIPSHRACCGRTRMLRLTAVRLIGSVSALQMQLVSKSISGLGILLYVCVLFRNSTKMKAKCLGPHPCNETSSPQSPPLLGWRRGWVRYSSMAFELNTLLRPGLLLPRAEPVSPIGTNVPLKQGDLNCKFPGMLSSGRRRRAPTASARPVNARRRCPDKGGHGILRECL